MTSDRDTIAIIGLGLIGGSIARDLVSRGVRIAGYDTDPATLEMAWEEGIVRERVDASFSQLDGARIVILAVPVSATSGVLTNAAKYLSGATLVTDVGSTKRSAIAAAQSLGLGERYVGSHPMAGDHRFGWYAARKGLFVGATTYLCPTASTVPEALELAQELWTLLGARPVVIDAETHDERVAFTSHLPHAVSAAVALALANAKYAREDLGPGGRDMLRIAASSPELWTAIMEDNSDAVRRALRALGIELKKVARALETRDASALHEILRAARAWTIGAGES